MNNFTPPPPAKRRNHISRPFRLPESFRQMRNGQAPEGGSRFKQTAQSLRALALSCLLALPAAGALAQVSPNQHEMMRQYGLDCSQRYDGCGNTNSGNTNSGGGQTIVKGLPTYHWAAVVSTHPQASNMPMFFSNKDEFISESHSEKRVGRLQTYGLIECEKQYGAGYCVVTNSAYSSYRDSYVAVVSTAKKGSTDPNVTSVRWDHGSKARAEQAAIQGCQNTAAKNGFNPQDCRVIDSRSFADVGNRIRGGRLYSDELEARLPCEYFNEGLKSACEKRRGTGR